MIKAIVRNGAIHPIEPLPLNWVDGREVIVEEAEPEDSPESMAAWNASLDELAAQFAPGDFDRMDQVLKEADAQAKELVRRQMGLN